LLNLNLFENENCIPTIIDRLNRISANGSKEWNAQYVFEDDNTKRKLEIFSINRGVKETFVISREDLISDDLKSLNNMKDFLHSHFLKNCIFSINSEKFELYGPIDLAEKITALGKKGSQVNRYKGLGEMNPVQLWETTLDPNARYLLQVKVENEGDAEETFSTLMGETVEHRRAFIQDNALKVSNLDI
jgi:DNA gyrase subunit B